MINMQTATAPCPACEAPIEVDAPKEGELVECPGCDCVSIVSQVSPLVIVAEDDEDEFDDDDDDDDEDDDWPEDEDDED